MAIKRTENQAEKDKVLTHFGKRLAEIRTQKGITQENFALELGVDRTYISYIERGKRNPSLYLLYKMAQLLKVELTHLVNI